MEPRPIVACVGQTNVDRVFEIEGELLVGEKHRARSVVDRVGGGAANAAIAVAHLGGRALLVSRVGADETGRSVCDELEHHGVDVTGVQRCVGVTTAVSSVVVDGSGGRTIVGRADPGLRAGAPGDLPAVDAVVTDARWPAAASASLRRASELGVPSVVDVDERVSPVSLCESAELATHLVFSERGILHHAGGVDVVDALRAVRRRTGATVAVTCGGAGAYWLDDGEVHHHPALDVVAVDTTGAGDVFHGAVALALAEGRSTSEAIELATVAAGLTCARRRGASDPPSRADVDAILRRAPGRRRRGR